MKELSIPKNISENHKPLFIVLLDTRDIIFQQMVAVLKRIELDEWTDNLYDYTSDYEEMIEESENPFIRGLNERIEGIETSFIKLQKELEVVKK